MEVSGQPRAPAVLPSRTTGGTQSHSRPYEQHNCFYTFRSLMYKNCNITHMAKVRLDSEAKFQADLPSISSI